MRTVLAAAVFADRFGLFLLVPLFAAVAWVRRWLSRDKATRSRSSLRAARGANPVVLSATRG